MRFIAILSDEQFKLYRLIWQRFVASQMVPAVYDQTTVEYCSQGRSQTYDFRVSGSVLKFDGFLKVYEECKGQEGRRRRRAEEQAARSRRMDRTLGLEQLAAEQHFTEPPPRYNEASLVKVLEERGIGRPSTYASIINTIQDREYVTKVPPAVAPGASSRPRSGLLSRDLLVANFPYIFDTQYTARLEEELDDIEDGKEKWTDLLNGFYGHFEEELLRRRQEHGKHQAVGEDDRREVRRLRVAAGAEVGQVRQLLCLQRLQQERPEQLHLHQGKHRRQA